MPSFLATHTHAHVSKRRRKFGCKLEKWQTKPECTKKKFSSPAFYRFSDIFDSCLYVSAWLHTIVASHTQRVQSTVSKLARKPYRIRCNTETTHETSAEYVAPIQIFYKLRSNKIYLFFSVHFSTIQYSECRPYTSSLRERVDTNAEKLTPKKNSRSQFFDSFVHFAWIRRHCDFIHSFRVLWISVDPKINERGRVKNRFSDWKWIWN